MSETAYIKLVPGSAQQTITVDEIKGLLKEFKENTTKTGHQLSWNYGETAFPYEIKETPEGKGRWFYLQSNVDRYNVILFGVDQEKIVDEENQERIQTYIQITLAETSTYGDKNKANEFCKYLSKKLKGELHLFNGRIMYDYPRK
ncbi:DUF1885 family protein [Peribacillus tepidiphilus]|uniref:DUF1885 family protein n=1 Tax=Peribacillus tepidiphilus TaxID=2652445 RepID=UPI0035B526BA